VYASAGGDAGDGRGPNTGKTRNKYEEPGQGGLTELNPKRVLDFVRALKSTPDEGVPGRELLCFDGILPPEEGKLMSRAIEESCERVDPNEW